MITIILVKNTQGSNSSSNLEINTDNKLKPYNHLLTFCAKNKKKKIYLFDKKLPGNPSLGHPNYQWLVDEY